MHIDALASRRRRPRSRPTATGLAAVGLVAAFAAVTGCGSSSNSNSNGSGSSATAAKSSSSASTGGNPSWCGSKKIVLGIQDGGGLNGWSKESLRQVKLEAAKCPNITKTIVVNAGFDPQKAISGTTGLVAQGANAIVIIPDAGGPAELPGLRKATAHGVKVVPWGASPGGKEPGDYVTYVDWSPEAAGETSATWLFKAMNGKGNVIYLGGPAGNAVDKGELVGIGKVLAQNPGVKLLTGSDTWPVTNWDPAQAQKVMTGLLSKYPKIDGILMTDGQSGAAVVKVLKQANRRIPPIATLEANQIGCAWKDAQGTKDAFQLATISGRNWMGRIAIRKAVAAANGLNDAEKSIISLPLYEDSVAGGGQTPKCDKSRSPDTYLSNYEPEATFNALSGYSGK
jgi:ribose transport system substrate-binding protein